MKITCRVLLDAVIVANQTTLAGFPFGFRLQSPDSAGNYRLKMVYRVLSSAPSVILCTGSAKEVYVAMQAILTILPVARVSIGEDLAAAVSGLLSFVEEDGDGDGFSPLESAIFNAEQALARYRKGDGL
jgi:hypothetical protein